MSDPYTRGFEAGVEAAAGKVDLFAMRGSKAMSSLAKEIRSLKPEPSTLKHTPPLSIAIEALEKANMQLTAYGANNTAWIRDAIAALRAEPVDDDVVEIFADVLQFDPYDTIQNGIAMALNKAASMGYRLVRDK